MFASPLNMPRRTWILVAALLLLGAFFFFQYYSIADIRGAANVPSTSHSSSSSSAANIFKPPEKQQCAPAASTQHSLGVVEPKDPTGGHITLRLHENLMESATPVKDTWNFAVMPTKPDVFIVTEDNMPAMQGHYEREHYIYSLMKWILRVYRKDQGRISRNEPLLMIDAGSNHGLFSMVAGVSGAHVVAFEPQTHLRNVIGYGARLNQIDRDLRILPFAVLNKFTKVSISNYEIGDGGIAFLDFNRQTGPIQTQTIRLDHMPSFDRLFPALGPNALGPHSENFGEDYAAYLKEAHDLDPESQPKLTSADTKTLLLRQPIHFLKIDVEGFELRALESSSALYEAGLIEHTVLEFGAPHRWVVTESSTLSPEEVKARTLAEAKMVLHKAAGEWNLDIYLLPSMGWENCKNWMRARLANIAPDDTDTDLPTSPDGVHWIKAWDFDGSGDWDEFDKELKATNNGVTQFIKLPAIMIDAFLDDLANIGEVYLWLAKKGSNPAVRKDIV